jgi:hypothetical protein
MEVFVMSTLAVTTAHSPLALLRTSTTIAISVATISLLACLAPLAFAQEVSFDFDRLVEYRDVTPPERLKRSPHERLIEMKLPVSVRFQGLTIGEIEHLDFEIDGSDANIRVAGFSPATVLAADAVSIETTNKTTKERSLGAKLSGTIPVPIGPLACEVGPSISGDLSRADETSEKIKRVPPKKPIVVSGTFAQSRGVFFKFKQSPQTTFEGVHELVVVFAVPSNWNAGAVRISATARGHKQRLWMDQPTVFGEVTTVIELYPEGDYTLRKAALRRIEASAADSSRSWSLGDLFLTGGSRS